MRRLISSAFAVAVFIGMAMPCAAQQDIVSVGDARLQLPPPKKFVSVPSSSPAYLEGEQWTAPSNRLLALYLPHQASDDSKPKYMRRIAVQSYRKSESANVSIEEFQKLRQHFRVSNQAAIDSVVDRSNKHHPTEGAAIGRLAQSVKVGEARALEMFNEESNWSVSMVMLAKYVMQVDGKTVEAPVVFTNMKRPGFSGGSNS